MLGFPGQVLLGRQNGPARAIAVAGGMQGLGVDQEDQSGAFFEFAELVEKVMTALCDDASLIGAAKSQLSLTRHRVGQCPVTGKVFELVNGLVALLQGLAGTAGQK